MGLEKILMLGDLQLYEHSEALEEKEVELYHPVYQELHQLILEFRMKHSRGRAIAAPQIGVRKRIVCWNTGTPVTMINPVLSDLSPEMMEVWDDCMSFPGLLVKVRRHRHCRLDFTDETGRHTTWHLTDDQSELIQHEVDHLDGILATQRAVDGRSFKLEHFHA